MEERVLLFRIPLLLMLQKDVLEQENGGLEFWMLGLMELFQQCCVHILEVARSDKY